MKITDPVRVLIADDQPVLRLGLYSVLTRQPDLQPVGEAVSDREVLEQCRRLKPDVIVIDGSLSLPALIPRLQKRSSSCKVVVLVQVVEPEAVYYLINLGVDGIVSLADPSESVVEAIRTVAKGSKYFSELVLDQ